MASRFAPCVVGEGRAAGPDGAAHGDATACRRDGDGWPGRSVPKPPDLFFPPGLQAESRSRAGILAVSLAFTEGVASKHPTDAGILTRW